MVEKLNNPQVRRLILSVGMKFDPIENASSISAWNPRYLLRKKDSSATSKKQLFVTGKTLAKLLSYEGCFHKSARRLEAVAGIGCSSRVPPVCEILAD